MPLAVRVETDVCQHAANAVLDSPGLNEQRFGNRSVRVRLRHQAQYLEFTRT